MDNKQHYLDIAAGQGKKEPSRIVAFPAQPLNYALYRTTPRGTDRIHRW